MEVKKPTCTTTTSLQSLGFLNKEDSILLVCDIQERFSSIIHAWEAMVSAAVLLCDACVSLEIPVYVTEQYPKGLGHTVEPIKTALNKSDSKNYMIESKTKFSMCTEQLKSHIRDKKQIIIVGAETHVCVLQTCIELITLGKQVHLVCDGISSSRQWERQIALERMSKIDGVFLTTAESVLFQLTGDASHPKFKDISSLVKKTRPDPKL